ncbi:hypothetical protein DL768_001275 [Monosporascus sp. mg162]|nr:hypothetical protein DL768_001275 [Monosporascus sp. mg162]
MELSSRITASKAMLSNYFVANHLPTPSFDVDGPQDALVPKCMVDVKAARVAILDDTEELRRLRLRPGDYLISYSADELLSQHAITRFRLAHSFPVGGEATFGEIAAISGLSETNVRRIIRHAVVKDILQEPRSGVVLHTRCRARWPRIPSSTTGRALAARNFGQLPPRHVMPWRDSPGPRSQARRP